jgi:hypothetical protein
MGGVLRPYNRRSRVTLDWALVAVGLMACAVLAGLVIRTDGSGQSSLFGAQVGGLRTLSENQTLVVFEDMSSGGGADWSGGLRNADHAGLGAVWLADPPSDPLSRDIALPEDTVRAVLSFDLIAIDAWALEGLEVALGGAPVMLHRFASPPDPDGLLATPRTTDRLAVRLELAEPRDLGFAPSLAEQRLNVELAVTTPGDSLSLTITPVPSDAGDSDRPAPLWAVDNLIVVAERLP